MSTFQKGQCQILNVIKPISQCQNLVYQDPYTIFKHANQTQICIIHDLLLVPVCYKAPCTIKILVHASKMANTKLNGRNSNLKCIRD